MSPPFPLTPDGLPCLRWTEDEEDPRLCRNYYSRNTALESPDHDDDGGGGGGDGSDGSCPAGFKEASREPLWWDTCKKNNHLEGASWGGNKEGGKCDNPNAPKFGVIPPPCGTCKEPSPTAGPLDKCGCSNSNGVCAIACGYPKLKTAADVKSKCPARPCTNMTSAALNCTAAQRLECSNPTEGKNMCVQKAAGHCELDKCAEAFFRTDDYNCCPGNFYDKKQIAGLKCPNEKKDKEHLKKYKVAHCNNPLGCEEGAFDVSALSDCGAVTVNHASGLPVTLNNSNINVKTFDVVCDNACKCNPKGLEPGQGLYSPPRCRVGGQDYASAIDTCYCDGNTRAYDMSHTAVDLCGYQLPIFGKTIPGGQANAYKAYALANGLKNNFPDDLFCKPK